MTDGEGGEHDAHFLPSVILGASPGIQALFLPPLSFAVILGASPGIQSPTQAF